MHDPPLTLGAVARRCGCLTWQVRRLFERGLLPPAQRVGAYRVIAPSDLPLVEQALRSAGYLRDTGGTSDAASSR
jgi:DNA-binding transcriptional MerR regulator